MFSLFCCKRSITISYSDTQPSRRTHGATKPGVASTKTGLGATTTAYEATKTPPAATQTTDEVRSTGQIVSQ